MNLRTFDDGAFDCVVSTFVLNSCYDRKALAKEMRRLCKPDGYILILERGSSTFTLYNSWLNFRAARDLMNEGTVEHLEIDKIVDELFEGLEMVHRERKNMGMTYCYVIRNS